MNELLPLIGVSADLKSIDGRPFHAVGDKYLAAVAQASNAAPLIIPALAEHLDIAALLGRLDGILLTGSPSNVHPAYYQGEATAEHEPYDAARDALTLDLSRQAVAQQVPMLAICRGFQELNVAFGGTLHAALHRLPNRLDHRRVQHEDADKQYALQHPVTFIEGGEFHKRFGLLQVQVNSLHRQGIDVLAPGLVAEGVAPDGTVEAVSVKAAKHFALGVQWHPEYKFAEHGYPDYSLRLFQAFGEAARERAQARCR